RRCQNKRTARSRTCCTRAMPPGPSQSMVQLPQEIAMDTFVLSELRMKGRCKHTLLLHQDRQAIGATSYPHPFTNAANDRGANKYHLDRVICNLGAFTRLYRAIH